LEHFGGDLFCVNPGCYTAEDHTTVRLLMLKYITTKHVTDILMQLSLRVNRIVLSERRRSLVLFISNCFQRSATVS